MHASLRTMAYGITAACQSVFFIGDAVIGYSKDQGLTCFTVKKGGKSTRVNVVYDGCPMSKLLPHLFRKYVHRRFSACFPITNN